MKSYPSIEKVAPWSPPNEHLYTFDKVDGSNLRFEWTRKRGWFKYGTRTRLFDKSDVEFGPAIDIFINSLGEALSKVAYDNKYDPFIAFVEYAGPHSFAGLHDPNDVKTTSLIDVSVHKTGILDPRDYLNVIEQGKISSMARYIGHIKWNNEFLEQVRLGTVEGITFEGAVGKEVHTYKYDKHRMFKAKTEAWLDMVKSRYSWNQAEKIINS
jgi:hypothetical protein